MSGKSISERLETLVVDLQSEYLPPAKSYLSNELFYEKISPTVKWNKNNLMTEGECSKLFLRTIVEMAYREGKADGILEAEEIVADWYSGQKSAVFHPSHVK